MQKIFSVCLLGSLDNKRNSRQMHPIESNILLVLPTFCRVCLHDNYAFTNIILPIPSIIAICKNNKSLLLLNRQHAGRIRTDLDWLRNRNFLIRNKLLLQRK